MNGGLERVQPLAHFQMIHFLNAVELLIQVKLWKKKPQYVPSTKSLLLKDNLSGTI